MNELTQQETIDDQQGPRRPSLRELTRLWGSYSGIWIATAALFLLCAIFVPDSVSSLALNSVLPFWGILGIVAIGQTLVVQQRGIDLSVPGMMTLAGMSFVAYCEKQNASPVVALLVMLVVAALFGLANGLIITRINISPLITTLAMNALMLGAMYSYTHGVGTSATKGFSDFTNEKILGASILAWIAVALTLVVGFIATQTPIGRRFVAVGANPAAARALGIKVDLYIIASYLLASMFFAFAGVLLSGYIKTPTPLLGESYLFLAVIAVVVGGTSVTGGRGSVSASVVAALFLTQLAQAGRTLGAEPSTRGLMQAVAMTGAVALGALLAARKTRPRGSSLPSNSDCARHVGDELEA